MFEKLQQGQDNFKDFPSNICNRVAIEEEDFEDWRSELEEFEKDCLGETEEIETINDSSYREDRMKHSKKRRLDFKFRKRRSNPHLKNPWKRKKTQEHQKKTFDHVCAVKAKEKVVDKEIREGILNY